MVQPRKTKCLVRGKKMIRVWIGATYTGGEPSQKYFGKPKEADDCVKNVIDVHRREGQEAFNLSFDQRFQALQAFKKLEPYGVSMTTAVDTYVAEHCVKESGKTIDEGIDDFIKSCRRANLKPRTIAQYESDLSIYGDTFGGSQMTGVVRDDVEEWLDESDWSARTRRNKLTTLTTFYTHAIDKNYCATNPAEKIKRPKLDDEPIGLLTPAQTVDLFREVIAKRPDLVGSLAIAAFAGPRRSELCALDWEEIHRQEREFEVAALKSKTRQRRIVSINDTLNSWLAIYGLDKGPVTVSKNADVWGGWIRELARSAGIEVWPKNALRHGFGSFFFALCKDENKVAAEMGNSPEIVHRHYRAVVKAAECQSYWAIRPDKFEIPKKKEDVHA